MIQNPSLVRSYFILAEQVSDVLLSSDRYPNNPQEELIKLEAQNRIFRDGLLPLNIFVCPRFNTEALVSSYPENYFPEKYEDIDLFSQRIPKIKSILRALENTGVETKLNVYIGDNDAENYLFPFLEGFEYDKDAYYSRQMRYKEGFGERISTLCENFEVYSLSEIQGIVDPYQTVTIGEGAFKKEVSFFKWLFSAKGPYKGSLNFSLEQVEDMIKIKYLCYGGQGYLLTKVGGVLLQTEGPGVWLERTKMLQCTGSSGVPAIYPWIRKEELKKWRGA